MSGLEHGIADVFASLQTWLVSSGATRSMIRLAWAVLTFLWLSHVAVSMRPGRPPDIVGTFGRLFVAGSLLTGVGTLNQIIILVFGTLRDAGSSILSGLVTENWTEFAQTWLTKTNLVFQLAGPWFTYPWALGVLLAGILLGTLLFAVGSMIYLAILFFAHLTLLLAIFLAPLAVALLAAPGTARWAGRWAAVIVKTGLVVFSVKVIHAAAIYLAVIVPVREVAAAFPGGLGQLGGGSANGSPDPGQLILTLATLLMFMLIGTGIGVYAMLRAERLTGQFIDGVAFGESIFGGPMWLRGQLAARASRRATEDTPSAHTNASEAASREPWPSSRGSAQDATTMAPGGRLSG
jgi:hypothetical protein